MCVYAVCLVNVQAEQSKLSRSSWSSKISLESANGCKIYNTLACAASGSVKNWKKRKKSWLFSERSSEVIAAVFTRLCVRVCVCVRAGGYVTWAGIHCCSWWSLQRSAPLASACTSETDRGNRRSGPGPRRRAEAGKDKKSAFSTFSDILTHAHRWRRGPQGARQDLSWVLVGRSERALRVSGVQTGPVHVAVPDARLFQHFLETVHADVGPFYFLQEFLGVQGGPLESSFTTENVKRNLD